MFLELKCEESAIRYYWIQLFRLIKIVVFHFQMLLRLKLLKKAQQTKQNPDAKFSTPKYHFISALLIFFSFKMYL